MWQVLDHDCEALTFISKFLSLLAHKVRAKPARGSECTVYVHSECTPYAQCISGWNQSHGFEPLIQMYQLLTWFDQMGKRGKV